MINLVELIIIWICGSIDPGIMKKNEYCGRSDEPMIKLVHKGVYRETKICSTCYIVKPFRSHHCGDCGNCVNKFDHHCPWIGGCVGGRNYIYFFLFLCLFNINNIFIGVFGIIHIIYIYKDVKDEDKINNWIAAHLITLIPTLITIILIGITMVFTIGLNFYHIKLIMRNMSTKEELKKLIYDDIGNPYDKGCSKNCSDFWTRHKKFEDDFVVKDLRMKAKISDKNNDEENININKKPAIMPFGYSKKEKELLNKSKKKNNKKENEIIEPDKETNNDENNTEIVLEKQDEIKEKIISGDKKVRQKKKEKNMSSDEDDFSIGKISDENADYKLKVCNTSVKNNSNLNQIDNMELEQLKNKNILKEKNLILPNEDKGYLIARQRLEELSSEITINQEMKSSISFPNENSLNSSLSQN